MTSDNLFLADQYDRLDIETLNRDLEPAGFAYKEEQDIFFSTMYAWQRKYGYCRSYDEAAPLLSMIVDCEPIHFEYKNRDWLIEFWKGQYGMTTGSEIGVYVLNKRNSNTDYSLEETIYDSVTDNERISLSYVLKKNGTTLLARSARHWWLTGFKLGQFSEPSELVMNMEITLNNEEMRDAFIGGLKVAGYKNSEIKVNNNSVYLTFDKPHTKQPKTKTPLIKYIMQTNNKWYCALYNSITQDYDTTLDKLDFLRNQFPRMYKHIMNMGKVKQQLRSHR